MKAYKGFNKNLKCRDFQYEVGNTYEQEGGVEICEKGFHAIDGNESPLNVFDYYPPSSNGERNRYCEVELEGNVKKDCEKIAWSTITIGAEIGIPGLVKAHVEWVKKNITNENNANKGKPATAGYSGAATAGEYGTATSRGSVSVGANGIGCVRGNNVKARGGIGAILIIANECSTNYKIKEWKAVIVDGDRIKADTWYKLENGEFVKVE